jgi:2-dehydro-3-deoxyphosphogluconate aldolase/(4S)-4-hydroxy-2-oxoglutarate aldolase
MEWISSSGLVPVLRAQSKQEALALARAMQAGGVDVMEVTTTVPEAPQVMEALKREFGDAMLIGAGTVTTVPQCLELIEAGAEFVVSPSLHPEVIAAAKDRGKCMVSGALTPTEIVTAWRAGADVVKVFPCSAMGGASYLRSVRAPFPEVPLIPTGGVTLATAKDFLDAGAVALGVGGDLANAQAIRNGKPELVTATAKAYLAALAEWREDRTDR